MCKKCCRMALTILKQKKLSSRFRLCFILSVLYASNFDWRKSPFWAQGVSRAWTWYRCASSHPPYKCLLEYGKCIPINIETIMEDNKKCSLFPFRLSSFMQKIISAVKYWTINWFISEKNKITSRDKGQVVRLSTAGDWMEGCKCIFVTHRSMVARTVMCRQDGRGRFPVLLDDHSKCRTNSQRKSQLS